MKGVILAGGMGTRLYPLTRVTNKHLLPIGKEPMIWHAVRQLVSADIQDILIITSTDHMGDVVNSLGSGKEFQCDFTYRVQEKAGGIAEALLLAESFSHRHPITVMLGDNIFEYSILSYVNAFRDQKMGARVLLTEVSDPHRYGIAALDEKQVIDIQEKPQNPISKYAVVGCYMYDDQVFDLIKQTTVSARGELEISTVNNLYIKKNQLQYSFVQGNWIDAGTFDSLAKANEFLLANNNIILS